MTAGAGRAEGIRSMFAAIAPRYDLLNSLLSLGSDERWRREAAAAAVEGDPGDVLDVATGTGELALAIKERRPEARVVGVDFAAPMLDLARSKAERMGLPLEFIHGDALALPFPDESFDAVTIAYGLRNLVDVDDGLRELYRVLRPGGRLVVLEFPPPPAGLLAAPFRFYFRHLLPFLGGLVSGRGEAYRYLHESVVGFPGPAALADAMHGAGFRSVKYRLQTFGVSAVHLGEKR